MFEPKPLPLRALLDPRPSPAASLSPILDAVNIPLTELPDRTYELPSRTETVYVADSWLESTATVEWLVSHGREARLATARPGQDTEIGRLWSPNPFLEECAPLIQPGLALDFGCGAGREAIFLASLGWRVHAIDLLPDALERAQQFASVYPGISDRVEWIQVDLEAQFTETSEFDLATMFYFLDRQTLSEAIGKLRPGGSIVVETFTEFHRERFGKPQSAQRVLQLGELQSIAGALKIEHFSEEWRPNGRHTARLWARQG